MAFRVSNLPSSVQAEFKKGPKAWRKAVLEAISQRITDPPPLAELMFFMQHPERMSAAVGKAIDSKEPEFYKLRAEWDLYLTIVTTMLKPSTNPTVFLPEIPSSKYEGFIAAPTTGLITLMVNGRNSDGTGHVIPKTDKLDGGFKDETGTFDAMQRTVESLKTGDSLLIANWQFAPTFVPLTVSSAVPKATTWGDLLAAKAVEGVKIRVIIALQPPATADIPFASAFTSDLSLSPFMSPLPALDKLIIAINSTAAGKSDNFKYIVSKHPNPKGSHHQKFVVARSAKATVAYCGGLDIGFNRTQSGWSLDFVWHDVGAKLEGLIAHDLEREFVEHWNLIRTSSATKPISGWKPLETLAQAQVSAADKAASVNKHPIQMVRTLSVGPDPANIQRDDIWRAYFRLIGRAKRFIYLENQYFHEPKLADAIVKQAESQSELIVMVVAGTGTDDRTTVDPKAVGIKRAIQTAQVDATQNSFAMRLEFFKRLSVPPITPSRLRVYTLNYSTGITHTKLILVDDEALSVGSMNANPRGFFFDSEVNVVVDDATTVKGFRQRLWAHNLHIAPDNVATWGVPEFFSRWDAVAKANLALRSTPEKLVGEGVLPFSPTDPKDPRFQAGKWGPIHMPPGIDDIPPKETYF